ncbi:hypothetical protein [Luteimonas deserti]|uniref:Uncharacterized protein n=1 Tax=Luteimonas deserti TaxID=2752306 RepID=A0A7Z0QNS4_9GAMM|nr:hypothetical protein [Luteimonas deserti]NYZ62021.1 hypothetical protein [Luteimonas deserti]
MVPVLGVLFCVYPKTPRGARRVVFDLVSLALAVIAFLVSIHWAQGVADRSTLVAA